VDYFPCHSTTTEKEDLFTVFKVTLQKFDQKKYVATTAAYFYKERFLKKIKYGKEKPQMEEMSEESFISFRFVL